MRRWREAMGLALYGDGGFYRRAAPADHFRTSAHTGAIFASAIVTLLERVDDALNRPTRIDLVDIGAGRGELLTALLANASGPLRDRLNAIAVEVADRPAGLDAAITWAAEAPARITGLVIASEWLDNVPLDVAAGFHYVEVDGAGAEAAGDPVSDADRAWIERWWPDGSRIEIGSTRDAAWAGMIARIDAGLAIAIDYGHLLEHRPPLGTLTGFRDGREVAPVPDGSCDLTAHVAADSVAAAGSAVAGLPAHLVRQTDALRALGVSGRRPDVRLASSDPGGYLRALAAASSAAELTDRSGLGDHFWIAQPVAIELPYG
jgi:SAM-dependent MidA family methyltransferase